MCSRPQDLALSQQTCEGDSGLASAWEHDYTSPTASTFCSPTNVHGCIMDTIEKSIHLSIYLSVYLFLYLSVCQSVSHVSVSSFVNCSLMGSESSYNFNNADHPVIHCFVTSSGSTPTTTKGDSFTPPSCLNPDSYLTWPRFAAESTVANRGRLYCTGS